MAGKKQFPNGTWQYTFKRRGVLDKPLYLTFATEVEGDEYAARLDALLSRGIVPAEHQKAEVVLTIKELVREYERDAHLSPKDRSALGTILESRGHYPLSEINSAWVDNWISEMKRVENLAPATIRAKLERWPGAQTGGCVRGCCPCRTIRYAHCRTDMHSTQRRMQRWQKVGREPMWSVTGAWSVGNMRPYWL